ncbi:Amino-oxidase domain-containing protein [Mycena chlorophos]|uniref:Amino-oxidase domain-containing protein n=1 Tax=Mycena chlorophos TaxID=658473 RepID=A0A8H6SME7_MYCCL|nr:Amino-oxidase domain-containing protein [Mycena chlorophos]
MAGTAAVPSNVHAESFGLRSFAAKAIIQDLLMAFETLPMPPIIPQSEASSFGPRSTKPICIIGAGCAGLYSAMILESLKIPYVIMEAQDRYGGHVFTHRFNGAAGKNAPIGDPARYDYFDVGAMRFPHIPFMARVFDLFQKRLKLDEKGLLIQYHMDAQRGPNDPDPTFAHFNGRRFCEAAPDHSSKADVYAVSKTNGGAIDDELVQRGSSKIFSELVVKPFLAECTEEDTADERFRKIWKALVREDKHSIRSYLLNQPPFSLVEGGPKYDWTVSIVEWLETFESATGLFDQALVESIMDALDFDAPAAAIHGPLAHISAKEGDEKEPYSWYCIDGGSDHIVEAMVEQLPEARRPRLNCRVTKIESIAGEMQVTYRGTDGLHTVETFSQVICAIPLGSLQSIDFPNLDDLSYMKRLAIRSLQYDTSTKVALKFKKRWWQDPEIMGGPDRIIRGGVSSTDLPIRKVVYPSFGLDVKDAPGVLIASYSWSQDAQRIGGLAAPENHTQLLELVKKNLAQLHGITEAAMGDVVAFKIFNWHNEPHSRGAFPLFRPSQFTKTDDAQSMFASLKTPGAGGKLHFAGEATSVHHAWILGALNSAWRAVWNALQLREDAEELRRQLRDEWGVPDEEDVKLLRQLSAAQRSMPHRF